jgi:hypothetical protein
MRSMRIRRRTGWETRLSDSLVVKPTPVNAERAWKRGLARELRVRQRHRRHTGDEQRQHEYQHSREFVDS